MKQEESSLEALAIRWLDRKRLARPSPASHEARQSDILVIARHLGNALGRPEPEDAECPALARQLGRLGLDDLTAAALEDALVSYSVGHSPASVRRVMSTWRGLCRWLSKEGHLATDPTEGLEGPARPDWKPKPLELDQLGRVVAAAVEADPRARDPWPERDRALVGVFVGAGVRIGEAIGLRVGDVEARERSPRLRVRGKGGRRRVVPVGPEVVEAIDAYLVSREARLAVPSPTEWLFVRADGRPFTRGTLDYLVSSWFRRGGVAPPPGSLAHALRHTYATLLVDTGASLPEVQRLLGHRDLSTTQVYLGVTAVGLEQAALANPGRAFLRSAARSACETGTPEAGDPTSYGVVPDQLRRLHDGPADVPGTPDWGGTTPCPVRRSPTGS